VAILETKSLTKGFGGLIALKEVSFELFENEILGIIGPNGAGKTTLTNVISGIYLPSSGKIVFNGMDISELPTHTRSKLGIGRTFQIARPLQGLSVLQNVMLGSLFGRGNSLKVARKEAKEICDFLGLGQIERGITKLTVLEIKKMEIARALAIQPKILFLDEVMAGLNIDETKEMIESVQKIRAQGISICVIEHVMSVIRELTERVIVLDRGEKIAEGPYEKVSENPHVISAYLGEEE